MTYNKNVYFTIGQFYWLLSYTRPTRDYSSSTLPFTFHTQSLHIQHQDYQLPSQASHSYPFVWLTVWPSMLAFFLLSVYRFVSPHLISFIWYLLNRFQCERFCVWVVSFCESFQMSPAIVDVKRRTTGPTNNGWGKCRTKRTIPYTYIYYSNTMQFQLQQGVRNRLCYTRKGYWKLKDIENEHNDDDDAGGVCKTAFQVLDTWKWNEAENDFLPPIHSNLDFFYAAFFLNVQFLCVKLFNHVIEMIVIKFCEKCYQKCEW